MSSDLVIMGVKGSPFVRKVQVVLAEKGVPYEIEAVSPFPPPDWFVEINPAKRIPVLRDRSVGTEGAAGTIPDSSPICAYIERKHPEPALYPKDDFGYGRALWLEEFGDSVLATPVGIGLFRPLVMAKMMKREPDLDRARKTLAEDLPPLFDYLERELTGKEFAVGDAFSIADVAIATQFGNFSLAGAKVDAARWPVLDAYVERMHARPSFSECLEAERKILPAPSTDL
jgi:glutathione S-transferase